MALISTSNPAFGRDTFTQFGHSYADARTGVMTVQGTVSKTFLLLGILFATAIYAWRLTLTGQIQFAPVLIGAMLGALILGIVTQISPRLAAWTGPVYAAFEGVTLGAFSCFIESRFPRYQGIAMQAVSLTGGTLFLMLFLYTTRIVRVTEKLRAGILSAIGAICLVYLVSFLMSMFGFRGGLGLWSSSAAGIAFSVIVVAVAAFSLLLDFDFIEQGAEYGAPKYMEWYGAFGLMVTLVWLYIEILRLLLKLQDRR